MFRALVQTPSKRERIPSSIPPLFTAGGEVCVCRWRGVRCRFVGADCQRATVKESLTVQLLRNLNNSNLSSLDSPVSEKPPLPPMKRGRRLSERCGLFPEFPWPLSRPRLHLTCVRFSPCTVKLLVLRNVARVPQYAGEGMPLGGGFAALEERPCGLVLPCWVL